jgi:hypothetical protein
MPCCCFCSTGSASMLVVDVRMLLCSLLLPWILAAAALLALSYAFAITAADVWLALPYSSHGCSHCTAMLISVMMFYCCCYCCYIYAHMCVVIAAVMLLALLCCASCYSVTGHPCVVVILAPGLITVSNPCF